MQNIHASVKNTTQFIKELSLITPIKISRLRERHAAAMGCRSYNHLVAKVKNSDTPSIIPNNYLAVLSAECGKHHQISIDIDAISKLITEHEKQEDEYMLMDTYLVPITSVNLDKISEYNTTTITTCDDYIYSNNYSEQVSLSSGFNVQYAEECASFNLMPRFLIHVTPNKVTFPECYPLGSIKLFTHDDDELSEESLAQLLQEDIKELVGNKRSEWYKQYPVVAFEIALPKGIDWNDYYEFEEDTFDFDLGEEIFYDDEKRLNLQSKLTLFSPRYEFGNNTVYLGALELIYKCHFNSQFINDYRHVIDKISESFFTDDSKSKQTSFVGSYNESKDFEGFISDGLYLDTIIDLSGKNKHVISDFHKITHDNFPLLMKHFDIKKVFANTMISSEDGCAMIWGCLGIDDIDYHQITFQLFSCPAHESSVQSYFASLGIELIIIREDEFECKADSLDYHETGKLYVYDTPKLSYDPFEMGLLIYQRTDKFHYKGTSGFHTKDFPAIFDNAITVDECINYDVRVLRPMPIPVDLKKGQDAIISRVDALRKNGVTMRDEVETALVELMHIDYNDDFQLCASLITFGAIGDNYSHLKGNINIIQNNNTLRRHEKITGKRANTGFAALTEPSAIDPRAYGENKNVEELRTLTGMDDIKAYIIQLF